MDALFDVNSLGTAIGAAGALGTACFGIVEGLKWTRLGEMGFGRLRKMLGEPLKSTLVVAYGEEYEELLRAQYREDWARSDLPKTLRQGVRLGLDGANAAAVATFLGSVDPVALKAAAIKVEQCLPLTDADRAAIGRFEAAVDVRIESALAQAQDDYLGAVRLAASVIAIGLAVLAAILHYGLAGWQQWITGLFVGVLAVPLAPIANEVVSALQAATKAMRGPG